MNEKERNQLRRLNEDYAHISWQLKSLAVKLKEHPKERQSIIECIKHELNNELHPDMVVRVAFNRLKQDIGEVKREEWEEILNVIENY